MRKIKPRNPVARHAHKSNGAQVHTDRKKEAKRGAGKFRWKCGKCTQSWGDSKAA